MLASGDTPCWSASSSLSRQLGLPGEAVRFIAAAGRLGRVRCAVFGGLLPIERSRLGPDVLAGVTLATVVFLIGIELIDVAGMCRIYRLRRTELGNHSAGIGLAGHAQGDLEGMSVQGFDFTVVHCNVGGVEAELGACHL
jgi:hypothetical protein